MTEDNSSIGEYFKKLTTTDKDQLQARMEQYRDQLEQQGYEVAIAEGTSGFFAGVLVIDSENGRFGFVESNGSVTWLTGHTNNIGGLGSAILQNQSEKLRLNSDDPDNADIR